MEHTHAHTHTHALTHTHTSTHTYTHTHTHTHTHKSARAQDRTHARAHENAIKAKYISYAKYWCQCEIIFEKEMNRKLDDQDNSVLFNSDLLPLTKRRKISLLASHSPLNYCRRKTGPHPLPHGTLYEEKLVYIITPVKTLHKQSCPGLNFCKALPSRILSWP